MCVSQNTCPQCPYSSENSDDMLQHSIGHKVHSTSPPKLKQSQKPAGLINYKCTFCAWYAKKKHAVFEHLKVHTDTPEEHYAAVERNLITPAGLPVSPVKAVVEKVD